jgi:methylated-DNA-[protein]-cysteine S-methyltransferase
LLNFILPEGMYYFDYKSSIGSLRVFHDKKNVFQISRVNSLRKFNGIYSEHKKCKMLLDFYFLKSKVQKREATFKEIFVCNGTEFQKKVWNEIFNIQFGKTKTYSQIALTIGHPKALRAVGTACGKNPFPIIIPCHRVVAKNDIGNFAWGKKVKHQLLSFENSFKSHKK